MLGFVGLLSSALAAVVNVLVVMLLSFLQAQMQPTEGTYRLATENGLVFPVESYILTDEILGVMIQTYKRVYGEQPMYVSTSCANGDMLDATSAKRYTTYNYIFVQKKAKEIGINIAKIDALPIVARDTLLTNMCFVSLKTKRLYEQTIEAQSEDDKLEVYKLEYEADYE